jgi:nicotinate-nucleotide adenylyltransferase
LRKLGAERLLVLVAERPGHKPTVLDPETRLELARLAFGDLPGVEVRLDPHPYTVDFLRAERPEDAVFVVGADQWAVFDTWKEPDEVLRLIAVAVAARPGQPAPSGDVRVFEIAQLPIASTEVRKRIEDGEPLDALVPDRVAREIEQRGLYGRGPS